MTMRKILILLCLLTVFSMTACTKHEKPTEPGKIIIDDTAKLLRDSDELYKLSMTMEKLAQYGNVGFCTVEDRYRLKSTEDYAVSAYNMYFGTESGILFLIDMEYGEIYIETDGYIGDFIGPGKARAITDNVYKLETNGKYYECADKAFNQALTVLEGGRISQKMKYYSNAAFAVLLGFLLNFMFLRSLNPKQAATAEELRKANRSKCEFNNRDITIVKREVVRHSSSSGGHHGGGRGGFGGGGHISHGGGHRF